MTGHSCTVWFGGLTPKKKTNKKQKGDNCLMTIPPSTDYYILYY